MGKHLGIFRRTFFLKVEHLADLNKFPGIQCKLTRSLNFLGIYRTKATVYLAGNHWSDGPRKLAASRAPFEFGILTSNGQDLEVQESISS
ncbi:hypothetical protein PILCRDRAFT_620712 [Piloderma croceum F 1598]|uniref:Uncharacterized protein n=1 Tax=Piloderma croceum (strain F 1598) TaxID=765440 RepID=A0A0C3BJ84_PILCF|nr:hypothetical protein PILCRDRAFT_620712 [Piloderma croceum F 1598]